MNTEQAIREALTTNDLTLWSASGAHVFNSDTAIRDLARSVEVRLAATPAPHEPETAIDAMAEALNNLDLALEHEHPEGHTCALCQVVASLPRRWLAVVDAFALAAARGEPGLDAMARDLADVVRRAPDAFCDLSGARHADLVERRVILAALATPTTPEPDQ